MEKKLDVITGPLSSIIDELNNLKVKREDIVSLIQNNEGLYVVVFYC